MAEKITVIEAMDASSSSRVVASQFGVRKTQINNIMNNKKSLIQLYSEGANGSINYSTPKNIQHPKIDCEVWDYYCMARCKNMPVNGPMLQAEGPNASQWL